MTEAERREMDDMAMAVRLLSDISSRRKSPDYFVQFASQEHRTRQQSMTRIVMAWIEFLASLNVNQYDLRNAAAVELCQKIIKLLKEDQGEIPYLPFI